MKPRAPDNGQECPLRRPLKRPFPVWYDHARTSRGQEQKRGGAVVINRALLLLLIWAAPALAETADIGWSEAVSDLAEARSKAQLCVGLLKGYGNLYLYFYGNPTAVKLISRDKLEYGTIKADFDAVIAGLITALAEGTRPVSLPSLEARLQRGGSGLGKFCKRVADRVATERRKDDQEPFGKPVGTPIDLVKLARAAIEPLIKALSDGVAALYNNYRKDDALTRQTIRTQLEAAKWPDFDEVRATDF
jgi:hypothetical protein